MPSQKPHVLVTNDDGIDSYFLRILILALSQEFRVTVAAPMAEQSWIGRAISRRREVHVAEVEDYPCPAYALDGTPSDCINIALGHLVKDNPPDMVCSGINIGFNIGTPTLLSSGTLAGAIEGASWGLPALALSLDIPDGEFEILCSSHGQVSGDLEQSLKAAAQRAKTFAKELILAKGPGLVVHNINFPTHTDAHTAIEKTEAIPITSWSFFAKKTPVSYHFDYPEENFTHSEQPYDYHCLTRGNISHSIIDLNKFASLR